MPTTVAPVTVTRVRRTVPVSPTQSPAAGDVVPAHGGTTDPPHTNSWPHEAPPHCRRPSRPRVSRRRDAAPRRSPPSRAARCSDARAKLGRDQGVEAICIAGDTYEHDFVREDTVEFLRNLLSDARVPVLITPGNHDPYMPGSVWQRTTGRPTSTCSAHDRIEPFPLDVEVTVWGAAFTAKHCSTNAVTDWRAPQDGGSHLLLIHGALTGEQWADEPGHRPLTRRSAGRPPGRAS